ncbi:AMP-binding protein [Kitasatospora purpeofusca]|uniref:AMP-binding protein n=1 Tax=Kitasatospora purpeofusca TaxID=67352 RepID=UPI002A5A689F|nr:AMP-binding protein [Kitasatospora purpeofusca]MDY0814821.1 AMP-binding protein [Kitasatospora purpeofusca]
MDDKITHLNDLVEARRHGTGRYVGLTPEGPRVLAFADLAELCGALAVRLARAAAPGREAEGRKNVLIALGDPLAFVQCFFAASLAGLVPVPGPTRSLRHPGHRRRLLAILAASRPCLVVVDDAIVPELTALLPDGRTPVTCLGGPVEPRGGAAAGARPGAASDIGSGRADVCYEQYTSGSTAQPRPIAIRQRHVLAQLRQAAEVFGESRDSVSVNWTPLFHDMGLVTSVLRPLWSDYTSVLIEPRAFAMRPECWPAALSEWRATHTSAPDFGYALCAARTPRPQAYDLRPLVVARSAGEPVRARTLAAFSAAFAPAGFDPAAFKPSYGLAEATLTVTSCPLDAPPQVVEFSRRALERGRAEPAANPSDARVLVSCGLPMPGTTVTIRRESGSGRLRAGEAGEVWIAGPQVAAEGEGGRTGFGTGDLGFLWEGELFLLGRGRDRFQVRGQNFYSHEIEDVVVAADLQLRPGRAVVFPAETSGGRGPALVVVAELRRSTEPLTNAQERSVVSAIVTALSREFELSAAPTLVPAGTLPLTTSGKVRRGDCRQRYAAGEFTSGEAVAAGAEGH